MNRYETVDADTLSYDARGNTLDNGINTYAYDVLNRQTVLTNTAAITTEYIYDARGRRVAKVTAGVTVTHYLYDIQYRVLEERDGAGNWVARYTYGAGIDEPLTMERGGQTYYYHRDALGSVTELSDSSGAIVERYEYDVYGAVTIYDRDWITRTASAAGNPYLFTARRFDPESGNYYYRARVYSPALGRFLSMDPLGFEAGDYNLYRYVENNPLRFVDPTGKAKYGGDDYDEGDEFYKRDELRPDEFPEFSDEQWAAIEYWAESFSLPVEFLAAVIAAEIVWDTDWYDKPVDLAVNVIAFLGVAEGPYKKLCNDFLENSQSGLPIINLSFGLGKGQVHASTAIDAEEHCDECFPVPLSASMRHLMLIDDETNFMYVAAVLRMYADQRPGSLNANGEMSMGQMGAVFANFHEDVQSAFGSPERYEAGQPPLTRGMHWFHQLVPFVNHYRQVIEH